jgi:CubicO group peptidase (beta-lactamase class C family)
MQKTIIIILLGLVSKFCFGQEAYTITYEQLKEFEGLYQYVNNTQLKIAASPKQAILFAIIGEARYPLRPFSKDVFLNNSNEKVIFQRNEAGGITGYQVGTDTFKILNKHVSFPQAMWYPRMVADNKKFVYQYKEPLQRSDGIAIGHISRTALDTSLIGEMMHKIVDGTYPDVHSVLILIDNKLVFEEYFYENDENTLHQLRSATKSFVSALTGIAIEKGIINSKDEHVVSYFPEYTFQNHSTAKSKITIENLLTNQSGLDCDISNDKSEGNETVMNYSDDWVKFTLDLPMTDKAGGKGMYCSGNPIILGRIIEKASGRSLPDFAYQHLFAPMGIQDFKWNFKPDKSSAEDFCQLYLRPRDMAKFGFLYLNEGSYNGKQIIDAAWVKQSLSKHSVIQNVNYGYLWWLKYLNAGGVKYYGMAAQGNGGQKIYIWPEQNMVTVITGGSYNTQSPSDELIRKFILPAFHKNDH